MEKADKLKCSFTFFTSENLNEDTILHRSRKDTYQYQQYQRIGSFRILLRFAKLPEDSRKILSVCPFFFRSIYTVVYVRMFSLIQNMKNRNKNPILTSSTMGYSIKHACSLNNQGVDLLVSGDFSGAMISFKMAVDILKEDGVDEDANHTTSFDGLNPQVNAEAALPIYESRLTVPGLHGVPYYVYNQGIMITQTTDEESQELTSAIVLFNMALTCHHEGRLGLETSLKNASLFYSMTVQILNGSLVPGNVPAATLTLLALNNKAQIHYDQCEYIQCDDCLKELPRILGSVQDIHSTLSQEDMEGLLLNVMFMKMPTGAQAA